MFYLGPHFHSRSEHYKYAPLLHESLYLYSIVHSVQELRTFHLESYICFGTDRHYGEVTRDEMEDIVSAMQAARDIFLACFDMVMLRCSAGDLHTVLASSSNFFPEWIWSGQHQITQAVRGEIESGNMIFVPRHGELRALVKAVREDREKQRAHELRHSEDRNPYATVQQMMGKPPRVTQNIDVPRPSLDDAQPLEYQSPALNDESIDLAGLPFDGDPGWIESGQNQKKQWRMYGADGTPVVDIDFDDHHGQPNPHAHNWDGLKRDHGWPVSIFPR